MQTHDMMHHAGLIRNLNFRCTTSEVCNLPEIVALAEMSAESILKTELLTDFGENQQNDGRTDIPIMFAYCINI